MLRLIQTSRFKRNARKRNGHLIAPALVVTVLLTITSSNARSNPPPLAALSADLSLGSGALMSFDASAMVNLSLFWQ